MSIVSSGQITITDLLDGKNGVDGKDGIAGKDGVGVKTTVITYTISTNGTTAPTTGWTSSVPSLVKGQYLWTKTVWSYTDNSTETGYSVTYISKDGNNGTDGIAGKDGVGISNTIIEYVGAVSGTSKPTTGWASTIPTVAAGSYLWTRTTWQYTDGTSEQGFTNALMGRTGLSGKDGVAGKDGVGIKSTQIMYAQSTSGTTAPATGWTAQVPTLIKGQYLWTQTTWVYTDNTGEAGYTVSYNAKDGNNGTDGIAGKDGVGITATTITYAGSTSGTIKPTTWTTTIPTVAAGSYLWTKTVWAYTDNTSETGYSVAKMGDTGPKGDKGVPGSPGAPGSNGQDAITIVMTNDNVTFPANAQGGVLSYANSGTTFSVLVGNIQCIPLVSTPVTVENSFSVVSSGSGIGVGSKTVNATDKVISYGNHASMSATSGATATITYTVTVRVNGANTKFTKVQNFSKSEKGITGDDGVDSYTYFRYSPYSDGKDMTSLDNADSKYMGICVTTSATAPSNYSSYKWSKYAGNDANKYGDNVIFNPKWDNVPYGAILYNTMADVGWNIGGGTGKLLAPESDAPSENIFELNVNNTYITSKGIPVVSGERYMFSLDIKTTNFGSGNDAPMAFRMFPPSNDAKITSTFGNNYEGLVRVNGGTAGQSVLLDTTTFPIINDSNWNQRAYSFQIPDGVAYIRPMLWHRGADGTSTKLRKLELRKIQQSSVTISSTEPSFKYVGMQWKYSGTSAITISGVAIQPSTIYIWSGSVWQLYVMRSTNLQVDNAFITNAMIAFVNADKVNANTLQALSAKIGKIYNEFEYEDTGSQNKGSVTIENDIQFTTENLTNVNHPKTNIALSANTNFTGLMVQYLPKKDASAGHQTAYYTYGGIYMQDNINNWGGQITAENVTLVPWKNLILQSGYTTGDGMQPQYRRIKNLDGSYSVQFRGAVSPTSGNFPTGQVHVATLSGVYMPPTTSIRQSSDNTGKGARVAMTTSGNLHILAPNTSSYVYLEALTYVN